eukprot:scaffold5640_cov328-Prasinococcus_capsulatus_cf.AAC.10
MKDIEDGSSKKMPKGKGRSAIDADEHQHETQRELAVRAHTGRGCTCNAPSQPAYYSCRSLAPSGQRSHPSGAAQSQRMAITVRAPPHPRTRLAIAKVDQYILSLLATPDPAVPSPHSRDFESPRSPNIRSYSPTSASHWAIRRPTEVM